MKTAQLAREVQKQQKSKIYLERQPFVAAAGNNSDTEEILSLMRFMRCYLNKTFSKVDYSYVW